MNSESIRQLLGIIGGLLGIPYVASYAFNPILAKRLGKNPVLWFFLSYPLGPLVTIFLYRSLKRTVRIEVQKALAREAEAIRKQEELAAGHARKEIIRKKEFEQQEEGRRRQLEQQEETRRWQLELQEEIRRQQEAIRAEELEQKEESTREWEAMKAKIGGQHEED